MYIKLIQHHRFMQSDGTWKLYYVGAIMDIKNKSLCKDLIKKKVAVDMSVAAADIPKGCGLLMFRAGPIPEWARALELEMATGGPRLPFEYTIIWNQRCTPNPEFLSTTLMLLSDRGWDMAVPLYSYTKLTDKLGSEAERKATETLIHDLRVPYFNTDLMFIKRNKRTEELMTRWAEERKGTSDDKLAFLRAVYQAKPFILPLPTEWIRK
jgi:hypothetical protein